MVVLGFFFFCSVFFSNVIALCSQNVYAANQWDKNIAITWKRDFAWVTEMVAIKLGILWIIQVDSISLWKILKGEHLTLATW